MVLFVVQQRNAMNTAAAAKSRSRVRLCVTP